MPELTKRERMKMDRENGYGAVVGSAFEQFESVDDPEAPRELSQIAPHAVTVVIVRHGFPHQMVHGVQSR